MKSISHNVMTIGLPPGWSDATFIVLAGPRTGNFAPTLTVLRRQLDSASTSAEFAASQLNALRRTLGPTGFTLCDEGPIVIGAHNAYRFIQHFFVGDNRLRVTQIQAYVVHQDVAYILTGTDLADSFPVTRAIFETAMEQFHLDEDVAAEQS